MTVAAESPLISFNIPIALLQVSMTLVLIIRLTLQLLFPISILGPIRASRPLGAFLGKSTI